jgi:hypothetical protein
VVNKALDEHTKIECTSKPGALGKRGDHGKKGEDGKVGVIRLPSDFLKTRKGLKAEGLHAETVTYPVDPEPRSGEERYKSLVASKTVPPKLSDPPPAKWGRFAVIHDVSEKPRAFNEEAGRFEGLRGLARVSFLHMLLEGARARYLQWDADRFAGERADEIRDELEARLDFVLLTSSLLPKALSKTDNNVRMGIHATASRLMINLGKTWDYFGNPENYVPLGRPKIYLQHFNEAVGLLKDRESTYLKHLESLDEKKLLSGRRGAAVKAAEGELKDKQEEIDKLRDRRERPAYAGRVSSRIQGVEGAGGRAVFCASAEDRLRALPPATAAADTPLQAEARVDRAFRTARAAPRGPDLADRGTRGQTRFY